MAEHTIAAVIPVHNKAPFVARAISSVLAQTTPVHEIVIVDDASTDGSREQVEKFLDDPRCRLLRRDGRPGPGGYAARNLAIRSATSQWIAFLDADDTWHSHYIEEIVELIDHAPITTGCVFTGYDNVHWNNSIIRDKYSARYKAAGFKSLDFDSFVAAWVDLRSCPMWTTATVVQRDLLLKLGLFPEGRCRRGGDKDMWFRVMAHADALGSPRICATYYRDDTGNRVTRNETTNSRPCLSTTLEKALSNAAGRRRVLLKRLFNCEVFDYALRVEQRERVSPETYRGFFVWSNPLWYVTLLTLTYMPVPLQKFLRRSLFLSGVLDRKNT